MRWDIHTNAGVIYRASSLEDAEIILARMQEGNRWFAVNQGEGYIVEAPGEPDPTPIDELELTWQASWTRGHAGWDVFPTRMTHGFVEGVTQINRDYKAVNVIAPSALEAIERAKFLLIAGGRNA